ncbi:MAG: hypothetical protein KGH88_08725 [Thaumarchaeota archaeon]|nr:hypothetical protein [Nitrososphaerota archaeon]
MWMMIISGGGLLFTIIAPLEIHGSGRYDEILDSTVKAGIAILLVILWVFIVSKIKNWIFHKQIQN